MRTCSERNSLDLMERWLNSSSGESLHSNVHLTRYLVARLTAHLTAHIEGHITAYHNASCDASIWTEPFWDTMQKSIQSKMSTECSSAVLEKCPRCNCTELLNWDALVNTLMHASMHASMHESLHVPLHSSNARLAVCNAASSDARNTDWVVCVNNHGDCVRSFTTAGCAAIQLEMKVLNNWKRRAGE